MDFIAVKMSPEYLFRSTGCMTYGIYPKHAFDATAPIGKMLDYSRAPYKVENPFQAQITTELYVNAPRSVEGDDRDAVLRQFRNIVEKNNRYISEYRNECKNTLEGLDDVQYIEYLPIDDFDIYAWVTLKNTGTRPIKIKITLGELFKMLVHGDELFSVKRPIEMNGKISIHWDFVDGKYQINLNDFGEAIAVQSD